MAAGNIRAFAARLNSDALLNTQSVQHSEKVVMQDSVPAASRKLCRSSVSNYGDFLCLYMFGTFETLHTEGGEVTAVVDTGIDYLRGQLSDSIGQRKLFNDFIPFSLFLSPGRRRSTRAANYLQTLSDPVAAIAGDGNPLFYPQEFEYLFAANSEILLDVYNDSNIDLSFEIVFSGIRILSASAVDGVREMRRG
jgi:hypothetical protein